MATESQDGLSDHLRGVTVTTLACLAGVIALIVGALTAAQFPILRVIGIDVSEFGAKDYLYVVFMTFTLWFVTFGIILTEGVSI